MKQKKKIILIFVSIVMIAVIGLTVHIHPKENNPKIDIIRENNIKTRDLAIDAHSFEMNMIEIAEDEKTYLKEEYVIREEEPQICMEDSPQETLPSSATLDKDSPSKTADTKQVQSPSESEKKNTIEKSSDSSKKEKSKTSSVHTHSWAPLTETVHHDAEYKTIHHDAVMEKSKIIDKEAWNENIYTEYCVCNKCGFKTTDYSDLDAHFWDAHDYEYSNYHTESVVTSVINHPEEFHYENIVKKEAYDERIVVKEAWDEKRTIGYKCSSCGERK